MTNLHDSVKITKSIHNDKVSAQFLTIQSTIKSNQINANHNNSQSKKNIFNIG